MNVNSLFVGSAAVTALQVHFWAVLKANPFLEGRPCSLLHSSVFVPHHCQQDHLRQEASPEPPSPPSYRMDWGGGHS